jgi:hypothetical protein
VTMERSNARVALDKDQDLTEDEFCQSLSNLYHDSGDLEFLYDMPMLEAKACKIFRPEEMDLPLVETSTALEAACGDIESLVIFYTFKCLKRPLWSHYIQDWNVCRRSSWISFLSAHLSV